METTIKKKTTDGIIWNTLQKLASKGLQFVFSVYIARILMPDDYGLIAIANLFISLSDILIDSGFSKSLIRDNKRTEADYSSVFWFNMLVSCILYIILFFASPYIAHYYNAPQITNIIRVITLSLIINAICGVQSLHLVIDMNFRRLAMIETVAMIFGGLAGIIIARKGYGVWALVAQTLVACIVKTIVTWFLGEWKPKAIFSKDILKRHFAFGSRLLVFEYVGRIYSSVYTLTIGKVFSTEQLGYYGKADAFAATPISIFVAPLGYVTFPAMSSLQDDKERLKNNYYRMIALSALLIFPIFMGMIAIADVLIPVLLTEKWMETVPMMKAFLVANMFSSIQAIPRNALLVYGESKSVLQIQILLKVTGLAFLYLLCGVSLMAICQYSAIISIVELLLILLAAKNKIGYGIWDFFKSILPSFLISLAMTLAVMMIVKFTSDNIIALILGVTTGVFLYVGLSFLFNSEQSAFALTLLKPYIAKFIPKR